MSRFLALLLLCLCLLLTGCQSAQSVNSGGNLDDQTTIGEELPLGSGDETEEDTTTIETDVPPADTGAADKENEDDEEKIPYAEDFSDAAFIGDSRTEGLQLNTSLSEADFFTSVGLMVNEAATEDQILLPDGSKGTVLDALSGKQYRRIYLMFGVNELGWVYDSVFEEDYVELLQEIAALQPDATLYVQTIFPVTKEKSESDAVYNNDNVRRFNERVRQAAEEAGATLIDTALLFDDGEGNLPEEASVDGVHLTRDYYQKWLDYLREVSVP